MQGLDAGLEFGDARIGHEANLLAPKVGLGFVEQLVGLAVLDQRGEEFLHMAEVDDVVHHRHFAGRIFCGQGAPFLRNDGGVLRTIVHARTIQAAEGAVALLSPPATPRTFHRQRR